MSEPVVVIAANAVKARLLEGDRAAKLRVSELLSYIVEGHEHSDRFRKGHWDGRSSFFDFRTGAFPAGFVNSVIVDLQARGYRVLVKRKKPPPPRGPELMDALAQVSPFPYDPNYDYQIETVRRLERHGMMIAQIATGGGKSMIARLAVKRIMRRTIFITTRQVLMYQMKKGFEEAGFNVGVMGDGDWRPVNGVNVAMIQTLQARLENPATAEKTRKILGLFEFVILEEAHEAGGNSYFSVMNAMANALYRLSLTATPFMRPDGEANMRLMGVSGQVAIKVSEAMLIERGILAKPFFKYLRTRDNPLLKRWSGWQKAYDLGIVKHEGRNRQIVEEVRRAANHGLSAMVLIQRTAHGETLLKMMRAAGLRVEFIWGKHEQDQRAAALAKLAAGRLDVLIGSTILDVGVDVPAVGMVVLAGGGKAEIALRQRIGRGLRAKKKGPNVCWILDFEDPGNRYLKDHAKSRRQIIEATPGFVENILNEGDDFPYVMFNHGVSAGV